MVLLDGGQKKGSDAHKASVAFEIKDVRASLTGCALPAIGPTSKRGIRQMKRPRTSGINLSIRTPSMNKSGQQTPCCSASSLMPAAVNLKLLHGFPAKQGWAWSLPRWETY